MSASIVRQFRINIASLSLVCALSAVAAAGCDAPAPPSAPTPTPTPAPAKAPQTTPSVGPQTPLVTGPGLSILVADAQRKLRHHAIFAPPKAFAQGTWRVDERARGSRVFRYKLMRELIADAVLEREAAKRQITVTPQDLDAYIKQSPVLNRFEPDGVRMPGGALLPLPAEVLGFTLEDVRDAARRELLRERLRARLLTEFTPEHFWKVWAHDKERVEAILVGVPNRPAAYEVDSFVDNNAQAIEQHYKSKPEAFQTTARTTVTMLRQTQATPTGAAEQALERLRAGDAPAQVATQLNLELRASVEVVRAQDRAIARAKIGESGISQWPDKRKRVWVVRGRSAPKLLPLDKNLRREIAHTLMRARGIIPSARTSWAKARRALEALPAPKALKRPGARAGALASLQSQGWQVIWPERAFVRSKSDFVPQVGVAPQLLEALFEAQPGEVLPQPVLQDRTIWAARVLSHARPSREVYEAQKDTFKAQYLAAQKDGLLDVFVARHAPSYVKQTHSEVFDRLWGPSRK